jgi:hypothetical protein
MAQEVFIGGELDRAGDAETLSPTSMGLPGTYGFIVLMCLEL